MIKLTHSPSDTFTIYRDGKLDIWATYKPILWQVLVTFGNEIDYLFVNGHVRRAK